MRLINIIIRISMFLTILGAADYISISSCMIITKNADVSFFYSNTKLLLLAGVISKIIAALIVKLYKKFEYNLYDDRKDNIVILIPILLGAMVVLFFTIKFYNNEINKEFFLLFSIIIIVLLVTNFCFCQYYYNNKKQIFELNKIKILNNIQAEFYAEKKLVEEDIMRIYHDLHNYIYCLNGQVRDESALTDIMLSLKQYDAFFRTGNSILDTLVCEKYKKATELGIDMDCQINMANINFIDPLDICSIFGNLLDNAIEYKQELSKDENSFFLIVRANVIESFFCIKICNTIYSDEQLTSNFFKTHKKEGIHGFGLSSVEYGVKKYSGLIEYKIENHEFKVHILIPIPD